MATRAERFKSEQAKEHARQHAQPASNGGRAKPAAVSAKANGKTNGSGVAKTDKRGKDHVKASTPLTSRELLLNMSPSARHQRRT
jgi:hypothetical protein